MDQITFADLEYQGKKRKTRRELFLERMDGLIPWQKLEDLIQPFYPKAGKGRRPYPLQAMLRVHCVQLFYNLSDPGMEDLLYESDPVRKFVGLKLSGPPARRDHYPQFPPPTGEAQPGAGHLGGDQLSPGISED